MTIDRYLAVLYGPQKTSFRKWRAKSSVQLQVSFSSDQVKSAISNSGLLYLDRLGYFVPARLAVLRGTAAFNRRWTLFGTPALRLQIVRIAETSVCVYL